MIVRARRAQATSAKAPAYASHFERNVAPELKEIAGFLGATLLTSARDGEVEFLVLTRWASMDAIRAFAGDEVTKAVVEPEAKAALSRFDARVIHFEVTREV